MDKLNFLDYLILDDIRQYGVLRDVELSRQLGCPRGLLLDRLPPFVSPALALAICLPLTALAKKVLERPQKNPLEKV